MEIRWAGKRIAAGVVGSIVLLTVGVRTAPAADAPHARIESVDGAATVLLQRGISLRDAGPGEEVGLGERIRTDEKTTVTISYADGSHLTILPNTDLEVEDAPGGVQGNHLRAGLVRGEIKKAKLPKAGIKFIIHTKTAVMGVRGTEFVVGFNAASGLAQFNTLSGTVEVATSAAQLMGGQGVSVAGGQFVQATAEGGVGAVNSFSSSSFLSGLGQRASGVGSAAPSQAPVSSAAADPSAHQEFRAPVPVAAAPPPKLPQAAPLPPPPPAVVEQRALEAEKERPQMHLFNFALGAFFGQNPDPSTATGIPYYRAFEINWTPIIPLPVFNFIYLRGSFGATLFEGYSLNNSFLVHEYQALVGTTLFSPLFVEVGGGKQFWRNEGIDSGVLSGNTGLIISPNGRLNRIYGGVSKFFAGSGSLELHAGIGIQIF